nr:MAG TPA: hypothetical protein [Caudoviricetes sp.]
MNNHGLKYLLSDLTTVIVSICILQHADIWS